MTYEVVHTDGKITRLSILDLDTPVAEQDAIAVGTAARLGRPVCEIWRIELVEQRIKLKGEGGSNP